MNTGKLAIGAALTLAVVVTSSSTTVLAMSVLPKNSVGHQQLKAGAVTTKKLDKHSVTGSKVKAGTFVSSSQLKFGKGFATSVPATTVLNFPQDHVKVTTDGTASEDPTVVVHLAKAKKYVWLIHVDDETTNSSMGGAVPLYAAAPGNTLSATITRLDKGPREIYLHCTFDLNWAPISPLACWAISN
jgi:hypothetical protein